MNKKWMVLGTAVVYVAAAFVAPKVVLVLATLDLLGTLYIRRRLKALKATL